ncbi:MAG: ABC transporter ATP-binding protein [Clostridia bacterium]|nr:ABC transporter ATP-binding protein [Clostridia bacterium]
MASVREIKLDAPEESGAEYVIEVENLVKRFGSKYAVDDVSFKIKRGEVVGFLGPNGAGKSTTINVATGYISSTSGSVRVCGHDVLDDPTEAKKLIGYLPEQPPLYVDMTVSEYLNFTYELKNCRLNRKKHLEEIYEITKTGDVRERLIKNLSKGYRQRVGIAQALVGNPQIIILDEPTVGLDPKQVIEVRSLIRALGENHTVFLSTHILSEVEVVCDRIIIINKGKIIADEKRDAISSIVSDNRAFIAKICGPSREVLSMLRSRAGIKKVERRPETDGDARAYLIESEQGIDIRKSLFYALAENNWPLVGLEPVGEDLENVFIRLVDRADSGKRRTTKRRRALIEEDAPAAEESTGEGATTGEGAATGESAPSESEEEK